MDCRGLEETEAIALGRKHLPKAAANNIFMLTYDRMRRYEGTWHIEKKPLFPSYVFLESENETLLGEEFNKFQFYMFHSKGSKDREITNGNKGLLRLNRSAEDLLRSLYGGGYHIKMSKGIIQDGIPRIVAGPLRGMEQRICRIDRHRRIAELALTEGRDLSGGKKEEREKQQPNFGYITAGLEITKKNM